ncbi:hypothetical protein EAH72_30885 [Pseudomonas caspiana]|nr:hypothetical protein [Pseudomonas caspiana]TPG90032.1 hypothetical protein EAH72_30885 [Pseudomonas caspiana]
MGLLDQEQRHAVYMNQQRLREFTAGRNCARAALTRLGLPAAAIGMGAQGEPRFPAGVIGSITHTGNYCAAALTLKQGIRTIGIDAQTNMPLDQQLYRRVLGREPRKTSAHDGFCEGTLTFSLKEAFYKAIFPVCQRKVHSKELVVNLLAEHGRCQIHVLTPDLKACIDDLNVDIRYAFDDRHIYSAVTLWERYTGALVHERKMKRTSPFPLVFSALPFFGRNAGVRRPACG